MKHAICGLLILTSVCIQALAVDTNSKPDPKAIVQRAADAIAKFKVVSYDFEHKASGVFEQFFPNLSGQVVMGKESPDGAKSFFCKLKIKKAGSDEMADVTAGADGTNYYRIDDKDKTVYADIDPQVLGKHRDAIDTAALRELGQAKPFAEALRSGEMKYVGEETVDGHECHVVNFKSSFAAPAIDWFFSKSDFLPRRTRFSVKEWGEGSAEGTMKNLKVDSQIDRKLDSKIDPKTETRLEAGPFALVVPAGYKKTDDFAP